MAKNINIDQFKTVKKNSDLDNRFPKTGGDQNSVDSKLLSGFNMLKEDEDLRDQESFKRGFRITKNFHSLGITK